MTEERTRPRRIRVSGLQETQLVSLVEIEQASAALYGDGGFTEGEVPARKLTDIVALTRDHNVRVAEADHVVAGYTAWRDEAPGVGVITTIAVHPDFQRVGVGSKLIEICPSNELYSPFRTRYSMMELPFEMRTD